VSDQLTAPRTAAGRPVILIDSYELGTLFLTDDASGSQEPIVDGLTKDQADRLLATIQRAEADARAEAAALAESEVRQYREALERLLHKWDSEGHYIEKDDVDGVRALLRREVGEP
jgi:hypothetical protein